jgi:6-phosphogluconolactonase (cycloisomerase 2 family)
MTIGKLARLLLAAAPLLAGCGNFWQAPSTTNTTPSTKLSSGVFFVLNQQTSQIAAFSIVTGTLTSVTGSPYTLPGSAAPYALAVSPNGSFLYVSTATGIYLYTIGSGGALTLGNSSSVISSDLATTLQVDATGSWLLEAGPNLSELLAIPINTSTGAAASTIEQKVLLPAASVQQLAISPNDSSSCTTCYVFVALGTAGTAVVPFTPTNSNPFGAVSTIAVKNSAGAALSVAVDPSNRLLYVGETVATSGSNTGGVRVFPIAATLTEASGSPYASGGLAPYSILPKSNGDYIYIANRAVSGSSTGNISGFAVTTTGTTYSLTALSSTASAGITPVGLAADSSGNFLLAVDSGGSPDLEAYTFDTTTAGKLDSALTSTTGTDPVQAVAIAGVP